MIPEQPSPEQVNGLVAFLPLLYADGFTPITGWRGGTENEKGELTPSWPEYNPVVMAFFGLAGAECWADHDYSPEEASRMLNTEGLVERASWSQIRTMLTWCVRGERFASGNWAAVIEEGYIRKLLERIAVLD